MSRRAIYSKGACRVLLIFMILSIKNGQGILSELDSAQSMKKYVILQKRDWATTVEMRRSADNRAVCG